MKPEAKFVIHHKSEGEYSFEMLSMSGQLLLKSELFTVHQSCISAIVACKLHSSNERHFQKRKSQDGGYYFNLRTSSKETLASSPKYATPEEREEAIKVVKALTRSAVIQD